MQIELCRPSIFLSSDLGWRGGQCISKLLRLLLEGREDRLGQVLGLGALPEASTWQRRLGRRVQGVTQANWGWLAIGLAPMPGLSSGHAPRVPIPGLGAWLAGRMQWGCTARVAMRGARMTKRMTVVFIAKRASFVRAASRPSTRLCHSSVLCPRGVSWKGVGLLGQRVVVHDCRYTP